MSFRLLLVAALPFIVSAFPQINKLSQADGFVFDGPTNGQQRVTSTTLATTSAESTSTSTSTEINITTTTLSEDQFDACVTSCPVTMEYNPVCGSDNRDYTNPGGLGCAQRCGKEITLRYYGRCSTSRTG